MKMGWESVFLLCHPQLVDLFPGVGVAGDVVFGEAVA